MLNPTPVIKSQVMQRINQAPAAKAMICVASTEDCTTSPG